MKVWAYNDLISKVKKRQLWYKILSAASSVASVFDSGTSTSNTTITTYGSTRVDGRGNASVYSTNGSAQGTYNSSAYANGSSTTQITTKTHDAFAEAIAKERAANEYVTFVASLDADIDAINENYLMTTTLDPQTKISGEILINKDKPEIIDLIIPVNGTEYLFRLNEIPK